MKKVQSKFFDKKIPTILGLVVLLVGLAAGIFMIGSGPGIFAPRATPQTTPKLIKISNVTDTGFSVSFITDETTSAFIKYGTAANSLRSQASDDRDSLSGNIGSFQTHHITVRGLQPQTKYHFVIGTSSNSTFDNNGQPYTVDTLTRASGQSIAQTVYGTVLNQASTPAEGSIVYVAIEGAQELSTLVRSSGTWAIPLAQARSTDGKSVPSVTTSTPMTVFVQGRSQSDTSTLQTTVGQPQLPVETITLGASTQTSLQATATPLPQSAGTEQMPQFTATESGQPVPSPTTAPVVTVTIALATSTPTPSPIVSQAVSPAVSPTVQPTAQPTVTISDVSLPSTESATPQSGNVSQTLVTLISGLILTVFGIVLFLSIQ